jgi:hypothetical protein
MAEYVPARSLVNELVMPNIDKSHTQILNSGNVLYTIWKSEASSIKRYI